MPRLLETQVPDNVEDCISLLERHVDRINEDSKFGEILRTCMSRLEEISDIKIEKAKEDNPLAFMKVSYEQALKLNAWVWGINFICDFDANRIGKTSGSILNALLWMFPNNPAWKIFKSYIDEWDREVKVLQRPSIQLFLLLQEHLDNNPEDRGNPMEGFESEENAPKFAKLQNLFPAVFRAAWPEPSFTAKENTLWLGAPDVDYHKNIIMPEWRKWLPKTAITRDSDHDKVFALTIKYRTKFDQNREIYWDIICKSYGSEDTKWSGAAVRGIVLTEGLKKETLNEIRQRFQAESFASWDYTPYEAKNTGARSALAWKVYQRKEDLPLRFHVYSGFGIEKCPDFILPRRKRDDLIRMWKGKPQGKARIEGKFFSDSPLALSNLDREFHTLTWTKSLLFQKFPTGLLFRGLDLGYDHPTVCLWALLAPNNDWYVYRAFSQAGLSIGERCEKIIAMSHNARFQHKFGRNSDDFYCQEYHPNPESEVFVSSIADYHLFKTDENTKLPYVRNYIRDGLLLRPSVTMRTKDRANECNRILEKSNFRKHPIFGSTPGSRVYFLINEEGVEECFDKLENLYWARFLQGEHVGMPKDELQSHGDDHFDAFAYIVLSPFRWSSSIHPQRKERPDQYDSNFYNKQLKLAA